ncbi:MAG: hypothetical protein M8357_03470 [Desulfobulbaceae bacterium]|nr:hypothetical protein [Desulfobulbaceae bacterium]
MKSLFILKKDPDPTINTIMEERAKEAEIYIVDLRKDQDYDALVESIELCDQVMTW